MHTALRFQAPPYYCTFLVVHLHYVEVTVPLMVPGNLPTQLEILSTGPNLHPNTLHILKRKTRCSGHVTCKTFIHWYKTGLHCFQTGPVGLVQASTWYLRECSAGEGGSGIVLITVIHLRYDPNSNGTCNLQMTFPPK